MIRHRIVLHALISILAATLSLVYTAVRGQSSPYKFNLELQAIGTTADVVPFWLRSNQFGSIPLAGGSGSFIGSAYKDYNDESSGPKTFDWGFGFEGRANAGQGSNAVIIAGFVKARASIFQLKLGRDKDVIGLNGDTTLSSGNFSISGNALGVPKVELSIPNYYPLPVLNGLISVRGNFAHGWLGKTRILDRISSGENNGNNNYVIDNTPSTYLHQKSLYVRFGARNWRVKAYGGFNHQVFWGNESAAYGPLFGLSNWETFRYVIMGKTYRPQSIPASKIGNQLGSVDLGVDYRLNRINISIYRQSIYETGALAKLANIKDGLNGITLTNLKYQENNQDFKWKKILLELFYTKDQAGYPWSKPTQSGDEDYYNNYYYPHGWSYKTEGLGNPFITPRHYANSDLAAAPNKYFNNNRVLAFHSGFIGSYKKLDMLIKASYSKNYGTFATSEYGESTGSYRNRPPWGLFNEVSQLSLYVETGKSIRNNYYVSFSGALDQDKLLPNSWGVRIKLRKEFK